MKRWHEFKTLDYNYSTNELELITVDLDKVSLIQEHNDRCNPPHGKAELTHYFTLLIEGHLIYVLAESMTFDELKRLVEGESDSAEIYKQIADAQAIWEETWQKGYNQGYNQGCEDS